MARIRIAGTSGASENSIVFSPAGGHSHNGQNSSLIDSTAYSMYDFSPTFVGTEVNPDRAVRQENNRIAFEDVIKRVVNNSVLAPAGIRLEPGSLNGSLIIANTITANQLAANTITAAEISAGTITANELSSNIVLINNRIVSQNWNGTIQANGTIFSNGIGSAGWAITNTHAVFDSTLIRGSIAANSLLTPNLTISNTGAITSTSFNVTAGGNVTATNANITGTITSGAGTIGGWTIDTARIYSGSTYLYSNGSMAIGATTIASNGQITNGGYTLSSAGALTATGANISGIINTTSGTIGGWLIDSTGLQKSQGGGSSNIYPGQIVLGILTDEVSGSTVLSAARMTMDDPNYFSRVKTDGISITEYAAGTTSYFKHFGAQLYGGMNLIGGTLTASAVNASTITGHVFNSTTGIRYPGPLNGSYSNMPSDYNFSLNFQYSNTGGYLYVLVNGDNGAVRRITTSGVSDRRVKDHISLNVLNHLEKFYSLNAYEFEFNNKKPFVDGKYVPTGKKELGLIADEVEELFPEFVLGKANEVYQQVSYTDFNPLLIAASLDQNRRIKELELRIKALEGV